MSTLTPKSSYAERELIDLIVDKSMFGFVPSSAKRDLIEVKMICAEMKSIVRHCKKILGYDYENICLKTGISLENYREMRTLADVITERNKKIYEICNRIQEKANDMDKKAREIYVEFEKDYCDYYALKEEYDRLEAKTDEQREELSDLQKKTNEELMISDSLLFYSKDILEKLYLVQRVRDNVFYCEFLDILYGELGGFKMKNPLCV